MKRLIEDEDYIVIFRPWITGPDGRRIYPKHGRVFPIRVPRR